MGAAEVVAFLTHLAVTRRVAAPTQNQALAALLFLYRAVLDASSRGSTPPCARTRRARFPVVLSRDEVRAVLAQLAPRDRLVATLLYGGGLRLLEGLRLRVKDIDFDRRQVLVRQGKGGRDRRCPFPVRLRQPLLEHLERVRAHPRSGLARAASACRCRTALGTSIRSASTRVGVVLAVPGAARDRRVDRAHGELFRHHLHETVAPARREAGGARCGDLRKRVTSPHLPPLVRDAPARGRRRICTPSDCATSEHMGILGLSCCSLGVWSAFFWWLLL